MADIYTACDKGYHLKVRNAALNCLSRREYTASMLKKKLLQRGFVINAVQAVLQQLIQEGLLSEVRFCETFIARRIRQGYGPVRIIAELRQHGVDEAVISAQLQQNESAWSDCIEKMLQKKFSAPTENLKEKLRQMHYLQYRGFRLEQIKKSIENRKT